MELLKQKPISEVLDEAVFAAAQVMNEIMRIDKTNLDRDEREALLLKLKAAQVVWNSKMRVDETKFKAAADSKASSVREAIDAYLKPRGLEFTPPNTL